MPSDARAFSLTSFEEALQLWRIALRLSQDKNNDKLQLVFLKTMRVFGLERLFGCFVIVGYSFPEERSRASN